MATLPISTSTRVLDVQTLLTTHDSGTVQFPETNIDPCVAAVGKCFEVELPYDDPLTIPVGCELSHSSYGEIKDYPIPEVA